MTLSEVYNNFLRDFGREFKKQDKNPPRLEIKDVVADIAEAQQEIQRRLKVVEKNSNLSLTSGANTFNLPSDFGQHKLVTVNDVPLLEVSSKELQSLDLTGGDAIAYAILVNGNSSHIMVAPIPTTALTAVLYYYPDFGYYSPSGITAQNWGSFDGSTLSGTLQLPDRYIRAITLYMLAKWFDKFEIKYENEIRNLRSARVFSGADSFGYNFGLDGVRQNVLGGSMVSIIQAEYSKKFKFTMIEGEDPIAVSSVGFSGAITVTKSGTTIVVTSANSEFIQPNTFVETSPADLNFTIEAGEIRILTYSGHNPISGEVKIW